MKSTLVGFLIFVLCLAGCRNEPEAGSRGALVHFDELNLEMVPPRSVLTVGDRDLQVEVNRTKTGDSNEIRLTLNGQTIDTERYQISKGLFALEQAAGETYRPPLPILVFPLRIGDRYEWKGQLVAGELIHRASAKVSTATETLFMPSSNQALRVQVDLSVDVGSNPSQRQLNFWFIKGGGLVKRAFGSSVRAPIP